MTPSACALSLINPPLLDMPHTEASTARRDIADPSYCHSEMQALIDADMSDDDIPYYHGNNAVNQPITGNGLDQVVFSFQRQFILSSPRRQNWPWSAPIVGATSGESQSAATPQTMFHEGSRSGGRHLSSGSAKIAGMPLTDDSMLVSPVCRGETNLKTCDSVIDSDGPDTCGLLSTEDLFGAVTVCNMRENETCETANKPCSARPIIQLYNPREHCQMSPPNMHPLPSTSREADDKPNTNGVQCDDDTGATFHGDTDRVNVFPWESDMSQNLWTEFDETKSESELTNSTGSTSSLHFSDVFTDLRGNVTLLDCGQNVLRTNDTIDSHNNTSTVREHLTHDWNDACMAGLSRGSDSDMELDRSTDTIETYMTDESACLEQSIIALTTSEDSASLASDLGHLFACEHDSDTISSNDSDNVSASDGSMIDRSVSLISLQSGTTNSDSLVNDNTRNLFLMTDNAIRRPVRCSHRQNSPMGSVNSDSLINGQNRDLFTQSNADDHTHQTDDDHTQQTADHVDQTQSESESAADDWYVYDERLTAELNSLHRLIDMRNYVRTQQHWETHGIIGPPPYEECPDAGGDAVATAIAEIPDNPPPPYTEHTESHTESLPPEYDQLSDHGVTAEDVHQRSSQRHQSHRGISCNSESETPTSDSNHVGEATDELDNDYDNNIVGCQTDNTSSDEHTDISRDEHVLDHGTVARSRGNDLDCSTTRMASPGCNPPSYRRSLYSLGHHLPLRWNTVAGVNQWASSRLWASSRMPS